MLQKPDITRFSTTASESLYTLRIHVTRLLRPGTQHANAKHGGNVRADGEPDKPKNDAGMINGMRMMRSVNAKSEATTWLHEMTVHFKTQGRTAMPLTDRLRLDAIRATEIRASAGPLVAVFGPHIRERQRGRRHPGFQLSKVEGFGEESYSHRVGTVPILI